MKTKEELKALREEAEAVNKKLAELSEEELAQVSGGVDYPGVSYYEGHCPECGCIMSCIKDYERRIISDIHCSCCDYFLPDIVPM